MKKQITIRNYYEKKDYPILDPEKKTIITIERHRIFGIDCVENLSMRSGGNDLNYIIIFENIVFSNSLTRLSIDSV